MRRALPLCAILATLASGPVIGHADELDGWCAQAKKASSIVICSDAELRQQVNARNQLFEKARGKLSAQAYKALNDDQSRWIKSYTARCDVSLDGPVPSLPIPQSVIDCYRRESRARTAQLAERLSEPTIATAPPQAPSTEAVANDALVRAGIPRPEVEAMAAWDECTEAAVDKFADQPESAHTVAEAAMAICTAEKHKYMLADGIAYPDAVEQATMPHLLARGGAGQASAAKPRDKPGDRLRPDVKRIQCDEDKESQRKEYANPYHGCGCKSGFVFLARPLVYGSLGR
jgi:uncharacterized protein YecT (DUF1311 family)